MLVLSVWTFRSRRPNSVYLEILWHLSVERQWESELVLFESFAQRTAGIASFITESVPSEEKFIKFVCNLIFLLELLLFLENRGYAF